jgi:type III restriction enzyme
MWRLSTVGRKRSAPGYSTNCHKINDDSREKNMVAKLAAKASKGRLLYLMAVAEDEHGRSIEGQIKAVIDA